MTTPTNEPMTVEQILHYLDDNVEDAGDVVYIRDDAIIKATTQINALIVRARLEEIGMFPKNGAAQLDHVHKRGAELQQLLQKGEK